MNMKDGKGEYLHWDITHWNNDKDANGSRKALGQSHLLL